MSACTISRLQVLDFLLVHLDLYLLLIGQVAHVLWIIVNYEAVVWCHVSRERNLQSRRICFLQLL
jgi:hypothetical protein